MKLILALFLVFFVPSAFAVNLKPGLWSIDMIVESDGQKVDIAAEMKKRLAELTPEQRKQMEAAMKKMGGSPGGLGDGARICLTREMLAKGEGMFPQKNDDCEVKISTRTKKKIAGSFTCKDGTTGRMDWTLTSATAYEGKVDVTGKDGKKTNMDYKGRFVGADCGDLKPVK